LARRKTELLEKPIFWHQKLLEKPILLYKILLEKPIMWRIKLCLKEKYKLI